MACCSSNDGLIPENEGLRGILRRKRVNLSNNNSNIESTVKVSTVKICSAGTLTNSTDSDYTEVVFLSQINRYVTDEMDLEILVLRLEISFFICSKENL